MIGQESVSTRHFFAAAALQGMIASSPIVDRTDPKKVNKAAWAKQEFEFADAMMKESSNWTGDEDRA